MCLTLRGSALFLFCLLLSHASLSQERHDGHVLQNVIDTSLVKEGSVVTDYIHLYQKHVSGKRGGECGMYPSCSNYGLIVFNERPFFEAMSLTADRLVRCGHDGEYYHKTLAYGKTSLLDYPPYRTPPKQLIYEPLSYLYTDNSKSADSTKMFVNYLINHNQYELALLEIDRVLFFQKEEDPEYYLKKLLCFEALNKEEEGILEYELHFPLSLKSNEDIRLKLAKLYYNLDNNPETLNTLRETNFQSTRNAYKSIVLQGITEVKNRNYNQARSLFSESSQYNPDIASTNLQIVKSIEEARMKSPAVARLLSIIPGGGYAYTKNYQNAVTSLVINTLLAYATYTSAKKENYGVAALMGVFSVSFYIGNIMGAGQSAERYNRHIINQGVTRLNITNQIINY